MDRFMTGSLAGKTLFITGASRGIGLAIGLRAARDGANVAIAAKSVEPQAKLPGTIFTAAKEVEAAGGSALPIACDIRFEEQVALAVEATVRQFGGIDILVNNAGITRDNLVMRMKTADWAAVLKTNLDGTFYCTRAVLPSMVRQRWGRIINIASVVAQAGNVGQANYIASKAGIIGLTKAVAAEVARRNITVNAIAPGFIATPMTEGLPPEIKEKMLSVIPMGRMGTDAEVAHGVLFLASPETSYITGHVLNINGGMYMA